MDVDHPSSSARTHVTDPRLKPVLDVSDQARTAALHFLDVSSKAAVSAQSTADTPPDISHALAITRAQKPVFAYLTHLRARNRDMAHLIREDKAATTTSRAEVDTLHLSLQNLQYENRHLAGEIAATENHPHTYQELDLISEEEFLAAHPEWAEHRKKEDDLAISGGDEDIPAMAEDVATEDVTTGDVTVMATPSETLDVVMTEQSTQEIVRKHPSAPKLPWEAPPDSAPSSPNRDPYAFRPTGRGKPDIYDLYAARRALRSHSMSTSSSEETASQAAVVLEPRKTQNKTNTHGQQAEQTPKQTQQGTQQDTSTPARQRAQDFNITSVAEAIPATSDESAWNDEALMTARIRDEYQTRLDLEEQRKKLVARKMELVRENAKRKAELGRLDKELEAFIEAAKPIQKTFEKDW